MFPDVWPGGHLNAAVANAIAAGLIVAAAAVLLQKFTRRGGGFDPSEVFIYRGKGRIPRNVRRVEVDGSVTFIPARLFDGCDQLEEVLLHEGLLGIGEYAFDGCSSLRGIEIPSTVAEIGTGAFRGCSNLAAVEFPPELESIEAWAFRGCRSLVEANIPASVTRIGVCAFMGCTNLRWVKLRQGLRMIGDWAFKNCRSLGSLSAPSSVDEIGEEAFDGCSGLSLVRLHEDLPKMKRFAFRGCPPGNVRFVRLSERVEAIRMDEQTASMFEGRLNEITSALTRRHDWEAAGAIWGKCKKSLERAHEILDYLELNGSMAVLELALWKAKIEDERKERLRGGLADDEDRGRDTVAVRQMQRDPRPSRGDCRVKCGAGVVSLEVRKFFTYSMSWPPLDGPE